MKILSPDTSEGRLAGKFAVCDAVSASIGVNTQFENGRRVALVLLADAHDANGFVVTLLKSEGLKINLMRKEKKSNLSKAKKGESDIDIQQLADNLKRSPAERIRRHQSALNLKTKLRKAKRL